MDFLKKKISFFRETDGTIRSLIDSVVDCAHWSAQRSRCESSGLRYSQHFIEVLAERSKQTLSGRLSNLVITKIQKNKINPHTRI